MKNNTKNTNNNRLIVEFHEPDIIDKIRTTAKTKNISIRGYIKNILLDYFNSNITNNNTKPETKQINQIDITPVKETLETLKSFLFDYLTSFKETINNANINSSTATDISNKIDAISNIINELNNKPTPQVDITPINSQLNDINKLLNDIKTEFKDKEIIDKINIISDKIDLIKSPDIPQVDLSYTNNQLNDIISAINNIKPAEPTTIDLSNIINEINNLKDLIQNIPHIDNNRLDEIYKFIQKQELKSKLKF